MAMASKYNYPAACPPARRDSCWDDEDLVRAFEYERALDRALTPQQVNVWANTPGASHIIILHALASGDRAGSYLNTDEARMRPAGRDHE
eukprot:scaffold5109_cov112-Isochrysis_galbana.AAC.2